MALAPNDACSTGVLLNRLSGIVPSTLKPLSCSCRFMIGRSSAHLQYMRLFNSILFLCTEVQPDLTTFGMLILARKEVFWW